jgi:hypothetical protein
MSNSLITVQSIVGNYTTVGGGEETVLLSLNGAAAAATVPVATGTQLVISDWTFCAPTVTNWRLQQTNDGVTFFDIALAGAPGSPAQPTAIFSPKTGWVVAGGANVAIRVRVQTGAGGVNVFTVVRSYVEGI